jgi:DNA-binding CsgD family transcriptional regulator
MGRPGGRAVPTWPEPAIDEVVAAAEDAHVVVWGRRGAGRSTILQQAAQRVRGPAWHPDWAAAVARPERPPGRSPVVFVDDIDLVDAATAERVRHDVQSTGARLIGTAETTRQLPQALRRLPRHTTLSVHLPDLDAAEVDGLIRSVLPRDPGVRSRRELLRLTDGRAGVLHELLRDLIDDSGGSDPEADELTVGRRGRQRVEYLLEDLDRRDLRLLERIALASALPAALLGLGDIDLADDLAQRRLIDVDDVGRVRVSDPLVSKLLLQELPDVSARLHARWLTRLLDAPEGTTVPSWIAILWRMLAGDTVDVEDVAAASLQCPDPFVSERLAATALAVDGHEVARQVLARVMLVLGRGDEAEVLMRTDIHSAEHDRPGRAGMPPLLGTHAFTLIRHGHVDQAKAVVETHRPGLDQELGRLVQRIILGDVEEGLTIGQRLLPTDYGRRATLIMAWGHVLRGTPEAVPDGLRLDWSMADNPFEATGALSLQGHSLLLTDLVGLDEMLQRWRPDTAPGRCAHSWLSAELSAARGDLARAISMLRAAEANAIDLDFFGLLPVARWTAVRLAAESRMDWAEVGMAHPEPDEVPWGAPHAMHMAVAQIWQLARAGDLDAAAAATRAHLARSGEALTCAVLVAQAALRAGVHPSAFHDNVPPAATRLHSPLLSAVVRHVAAAADHDLTALSEVADRYDRLGYVVLAAEARGQAGLASLTTPLPATPLLDGAPRLTPREREMADLAARGMGNAAIAAALVVSVRTVETHLSSAYRKLGASSRADLADQIGHRNPANPVR